MDAVVEIVTGRPVLVVMLLLALVGLFFAGKLVGFQLLKRVLADPSADPERRDG